MKGRGGEVRVQRGREIGAKSTCECSNLAEARGEEGSGVCGKTMAEVHHRAPYAAWLRTGALLKGRN